jgi:hypothetical protein
MNAARRLPDFDRLSILLATILLAYTVGRLVDLPALDLSTQLPGFFLSLEININTVIALLVAGLTASGTHWMLQTHPALAGRRSIQHLLLPALTALVIGVPLNQLPLGPAWWAVFALGAVALLVVLVAEYVAVDPADYRRPLATALLTAPSFALYFLLAVSLRAAGVRLFVLLPPLALAAGLVSLRTLHLHLGERWQFAQAAAVTVIQAQLAAALHYLPVSALFFGLLLVGPAYALTALFSSTAQGRELRQALAEPALVLLALLGLALWMR